MTLSRVKKPEVPCLIGRRLVGVYRAVLNVVAKRKMAASSGNLTSVV
jgi:hypothetical protein